MQYFSRRRSIWFLSFALLASAPLAVTAGRRRRRNRAPKVSSEALALLAKAEAGDPVAMRLVSLAYRKGEFGAKDTRAGLRWLKSSAKAKDPQAMYDLGRWYANGGTTLPTSPELGFHWKLRSAKAGLPDAQYEVGLDYVAGEGTAKDAKKGLAWLLEAGEASVKSFTLGRTQKYVMETPKCHALHKAGTILEDGLTGKADRAAALPLYQKAAAAGSGHAAYRVAQYYKHGWAGMPKDKDAYYDWLVQARIKGSTPAFKALQRLPSRNLSGSTPRRIPYRAVSRSQGPSPVDQAFDRVMAQWAARDEQIQRRRQEANAYWERTNSSPWRWK